MDLALDYDLLAEKIAHQISKAPKDHEVLWNAQECADYLHFKRL